MYDSSIIRFNIYLSVERPRTPVSLDRLILGFLDEAPRSGYDLKVRCFDAYSPAFWSADQAQIYRTLDRLSASGLVTSTPETSPGRPDRHVFSLTHAGRDELHSWIDSDDPLAPVREPSLAKLALAGGASDDRLAAALESYRSRIVGRLDDLAQQHRELEREGSTRDAMLRTLVLEQAMERDRCALAWAERFQSVIVNGELPPPVSTRPPLEKRSI